MRSIFGEHKEVWWYVPGLNQLPFDPANNNEPLQFGSASGPLVTEGLIENGGESNKKRKRTNVPSGKLGDNAFSYASAIESTFSWTLVCGWHCARICRHSRNERAFCPQGTHGGIQGGGPHT